MNSPDDVWYTDADGSVLVGEHGDGQISRITADGKLARLPQIVPEAEGIAQLGGVTYVADQVHNRVVALTDTGVRTVLQLQPDPNGLNLDGIAAGGGLLWIPDSPHGTVLAVDPSGRVVGRDAGYVRPVGVWANQTGGGGPYLVVDENANAVYALKNAGGHYLVARNLPGVDDVVRDGDGHVLVILPSEGRLYDVTSGHAIATGLRNPQGLAFDGAGNLLVAESDNGRLDLIVRTFALVGFTQTVQLTPGQGVCLGVIRAPGYTQPLRIEATSNAAYDSGDFNSPTFQVQPEPCPLAACTASVAVQGAGPGLEYVQFSYRD